MDIKAVLQWMAASAAGRAVRYYPFQDEVGIRLQRLAAAVAEAAPRRAVTVGWMWQQLLAFSGVLFAEGKQQIPKGYFYNWLESQIAALAPPSQLNVAKRWLKGC